MNRKRQRDTALAAYPADSCNTIAAGNRFTSNYYGKYAGITAQLLGCALATCHPPHTNRKPATVLPSPRHYLIIGGAGKITAYQIPAACRLEGYQAWSPGLPPWQRAPKRYL